MTKENIKKFLVISVSWLIFFLVPILIFISPFGPRDVGWFVIYFVFVLPVIWVIIMLLEKFWFNKVASWKKILLKYFVLFLLSYGALITWLYFNIKIDPFML
jgi:hypothetical protein